MTQPTEFNLFVVLDLDPEAPWNAADLGRRITEKRSEWSKQRQLGGKKAIAAARNMELLQKLTEVAASDATCLEHANEAKELRSAGKAEQQGKLDAAIKLLQAKGEIYRGELKQLATDFAGSFTEAQITSRITVPVKEDAAAPVAKDLLEGSVAEEIALKLKELGHASLYDFLGDGFSSGTQVALLYAKAEERFAAARNNMNKDARLILTESLANHARKQFESAESRKRYDDTLADMIFKGLKQEMARIAKVSRAIDMRQVELLVERFSQEAEVKAQVILDVIREHARAKGWQIVDPHAGDAVGKLQSCGYCRKLSQLGAMHCIGCGRALVEPCPKCASPVPSDEGACAKCGFPAGNRLLVGELCSEAEEALKSRDFDQASELLSQASRAWPQVTAGTLAERIRSLGERVQSARVERDSLLSSLREAASHGRLYAARDLLERVRSFLPEGARELRSVTQGIEAGLRTTARLLEGTRTHAGDSEAQVRAYQAVLEVCTDCREALEGLARTPPEKPQDLKARLSGTLVNLRWQASPSSSVKYAVVRKAKSRPVSAADGTNLGTVAACSFDDVSAEIGVPMFYAVFATRGTAVSSEGAVLQVPVQIVGEVTDLAPRIEDRRVLLQWTSPPNAHGVLVSRSTNGFVTAPREGRDIPVLGDGKAIDSAVENGRKYYYTVFSQFIAHDGDIVTSTGVGIQAVPQKPPEPMRELSLASEGSSGDRRVRISWVPPAFGDVLILRSTAPFGRKCGDVIPLHTLKGIGEILAGEAGSVSDRIKDAVFCYYMPVVVFHDAAYLGQENRFTSVDEASGLRYDNLGHVIRLQWDWPRNCNEVVLAHSCEGWPVLDAEGTSSVPLMRAQYDLRGFFDIECRAQADYYVAIHTVFGLAGQQVISAGGCRMKIAIRSRMEVTYAIKRSLIGSALKLELTVTGEGTLPEMVLVRKQGSLPMSKSDGEAAFRVSPAAAKPSGESIKLPASIRGSHYFGRLFLQDEAAYDFVTIRNPEKERLRLF